MNRKLNQIITFFLSKYTFDILFKAPGPVQVQGHFYSIKPFQVHEDNEEYLQHINQVRGQVYDIHNQNMKRKRKTHMKHVIHCNEIISEG